MHHAEFVNILYCVSIIKIYSNEVQRNKWTLRNLCSTLRPFYHINVDCYIASIINYI